jgi:hypothetical protein
MNENIQDSFSIDFAHLIGGPMQAIIEGEAQAARATADFIREIGFDETKNGPVIRNLTFSYEQKNEVGDSFLKTVSIPLLSVLPIPSLQVKTAEIDFALNINDYEKVESKSRSIGPDSGKVDKNTYKFRTSVARTGETTSNYHMRVRLELAQSTMPEGQARMLNLLGGVISTQEEGGSV